MAGRCSIGETHRSQQGTPAVALPHRRDGLSVLLMAVWCPFRRPSMCRPVHRELMRSELLDLTTIVPATPCHPRNYVKPYSRSIVDCTKVEVPLDSGHYECSGVVKNDDGSVSRGSKLATLRYRLKNSGKLTQTPRMLPSASAWPFP